MRGTTVSTTRSSQASVLFRLLFLFAVLTVCCGCQSTSCGRPAQCEEKGACGQGPACNQCNEKSGCGGSSWCRMPTLCPSHHEQKYSRFCDETTAKCRAYLASRSALSDMESECGVSCDFRRGFEQAFRDVALGSDGRVPAFPPAPYWKDGARSPEGHARAQEWFAGYATGAEIAVARRGVSNYVYTAGVPDCQPGSPCGSNWSGTPAEWQ